MSRDSLVTVGRDHRTSAEIAWAQDRPQAHRVPLPVEFSTVLVRMNDWGPLYPAEVRAVNVEPGHPSCLLPEPWPVIQVMVEGVWHPSKLDENGNPKDGSARPRPFLLNCQEARLDGSAGWLPLDHEMRAAIRAGS